MSGPSGHHLLRYPETLALVRLGPGADVPAWAESSSIFSVVATATETSVLCAGRNVPKKVPHHKPLTAYRVDGVRELGAASVLVDLLGPLVDQEVGAFTVTTFDTDWILVPTSAAERVEEAWRRSGHTTDIAAPA